MISHRLMIIATNSRTLMWRPDASTEGSMDVSARNFMSNPV
jgi:hypothetical protein